MKVKIKIAVSVNEKGEWNCVGRGKASDTEETQNYKANEDLEFAKEFIEPPSKEYFINAVIDTPEAINIGDVDIVEVKQ